MPSPGQAGTREYALTGVFGMLVFMFIALTGGLNSPLFYALYFPVLLAGLCFGLRLGLLASGLMAVGWAVFAMTGHAAPLLIRDAAVALSFPLAAVFARGLSEQMTAQWHVLDSRANDLSTLLDMSQMMDAAADLDTTLNLVLLNVKKATNCDVCAVYLIEDDALCLRDMSGARGRVALLPRLPQSEACASNWSLQAAAEGEAGVFYAAQTRHASAGLYDIDQNVASFACVALSGVEGLLGLLYVGWDRPHALDTKKGVRLLENLATRAAFSLGRAVVQQDVKSLAYSDSMTGLDNFRQFEQNLDTELRRAQRYGRELSLILLDIDYFKKFNDTLGHQAGDALLAQMGGVLQSSLRATDRPARYGGEEFVVLCPETGSEEAALVSERVRADVERTLFSLPGTEGCHVTVSVGYATFPQEAHTPHDLIRAADTALYAAKQAGRNMVRGPEASVFPALSL